MPNIVEMFNACSNFAVLYKKYISVLWHVPCNIWAMQ